MKKLLQTIILFYSIASFSQNIAEINSNLKISDSLTHQKEIRIYKKEGTTNYSELLHLYFENNKWTAIHYKYYATLNEKKAPTIERFKLKTNEDLDLVWLKILATNVEYLPNQSDIDYKLRGKLEINTLANGEYEYGYKTIALIDGMGYTVFIKNYNKVNKVTYNNPEKYLELYPDVDELIDFCSLLALFNPLFTL